MNTTSNFRISVLARIARSVSARRRIRSGTRSLCIPASPALRKSSSVSFLALVLGRGIPASCLSAMSRSARLSLSVSMEKNPTRFPVLAMWYANCRASAVLPTELSAARITNFPGDTARTLSSFSMPQER